MGSHVASLPQAIGEMTCLKTLLGAGCPYSHHHRWDCVSGCQRLSRNTRTQSTVSQCQETNVSEDKRPPAKRASSGSAW